MSRGLAKAAQIVGVAVAIAAAIPTGGTSLLAVGLGVSASTASLIALGTGLAAGAIGGVASRKKQGGSSSGSGSQSKMSIGADGPIPYVMGRTSWFGFLHPRPLCPR